MRLSLAATRNWPCWNYATSEALGRSQAQIMFGRRTRTRLPICHSQLMTPTAAATQAALTAAKDRQQRTIIVVPKIDQRSTSARLSVTDMMLVIGVNLKSTAYCHTDCTNYVFKNGSRLLVVARRVTSDFPVNDQSSFQLRRG